MKHAQTTVAMHSPRRALRWVLLVVVICPWAGHAETLTDAWAMALSSDGTLAAVRSEREAAESDHAAAVRQRWPSLDVTGVYTELQHAPILDISTPAGQ